MKFKDFLDYFTREIYRRVQQNLPIKKVINEDEIFFCMIKQLKPAKQRRKCDLATKDRV